VYIVAVWGGVTTDGDGRIIYASEAFAGWQQLSLASLIEGSYVLQTNPPVSLLGVEFPEGPIKNTGYHLMDRDGVVFSRGPRGNHIRFNGIGGPSNDNLSYHAVIPIDAHSIDSKIDDGLAGEGWVMSSNRVASTLDCADTDYSAASTANYVLSNSTNITCQMWFWLD